MVQGEECGSEPDEGGRGKLIRGSVVVVLQSRHLGVDTGLGQWAAAAESQTLGTHGGVAKSGEEKLISGRISISIWRHVMNLRVFMSGG